MRDKNQNTILQEFKVKKAEELLIFLVNNNVRKSRNATKSLLAHKQIRVNNKISTQFNHPLQAGDTVTIHKHDRKQDEKKLKGLTIVYEDKDLIIVNKDSGVLSVSTGKEVFKETVYNIVSTYLKSKNALIKPYILFRLDREVSGLMVFTKDPDLQEKLQKEWILHPPKRLFTAIVEGNVKNSNGSITSWLTENKNFVVFASEKDNGGLKAVTDYKVIKANNRYSVLEVDPKTSRKNQIRVQLQSIGHSVLGDKKYGSKNNPLRRISLHAHEISFVHPTTKETIFVSTALPKKMQVLIDTINKPTEKKIDE